MLKSLSATSTSLTNSAIQENLKFNDRPFSRGVILSMYQEKDKFKATKIELVLRVLVNIKNQIQK